MVVLGSEKKMQMKEQYLEDDDDDVHVSLVSVRVTCVCTFTFICTQVDTHTTAIANKGNDPAND